MTRMLPDPRAVRTAMALQVIRHCQAPSQLAGIFSEVRLTVSAIEHTIFPCFSLSIAGNFVPELPCIETAVQRDSSRATRCEPP